ncbi:hypothetical protein SCHPADRAFT_895998 [Schizopora paradoxa]|uniref:Uncharacterized protein n=1 Tax=Schizopora paradoxa TaxID=27342 RepID=A0A0H2R341_9AGAM|nr:hypothetical protein SCHPADRAFT_895998 [Schizopora paradoxa]
MLESRKIIYSDMLKETVKRRYQSELCNKLLKAMTKKLARLMKKKVILGVQISYKLMVNKPYFSAPLYDRDGSRYFAVTLDCQDTRQLRNGDPIPVGPALQYGWIAHVKNGKKLISFCDILPVNGTQWYRPCLPGLREDPSIVSGTHYRIYK